MNMIERAKAYCALNRFEWDDKLGDRPDGWDNMSHDKKHTVTYDIWRELQRTTPKILIRYYSVKSGDYLSSLEAIIVVTNLRRPIAKVIEPLRARGLFWLQSRDERACRLLRMSRSKYYSILHREIEDE